MCDFTSDNANRPSTILRVYCSCHGDQHCDYVQRAVASRQRRGGARSPTETAGLSLARSRDVGRGLHATIELADRNGELIDCMLLRMEAAHYRQLRILVVDDDHDVADSLVAVLEMLDYDTCVTYSGTGAIELAGCFPPDVVILDINMPGLNGWQTARHLRTDRRMERAIFIAHTAVDGPLVKKLRCRAGSSISSRKASSHR